MRKLLIRLVPLFTVALLFGGRVPAHFASVDQLVSPAVAAAQEAPKPPVNVDINVERGGTHVWYTDPTMLLIGGGALILIIALIAFASRGGGTTIVHEK